MKKRIKEYILLLFLLIIIPCSVNAKSIIINCDSELVKGNSLSCKITGNSDKIVIAVAANIRTGNNITFSNFVPASTWQGNGDEGKIDLYTDKDLYNDFLIGTVNFNVTTSKDGSNSYITVDNVFFYDEDGGVPIAAYTKNVRIAAINNDLSSLSLNNGNLNPAFNNTITTYSTTVNSSSVIISATPSNKYAKLTGDIGEQNLKTGNNNFKINVTSESGNTKTYTLNIVRPENKKQEIIDNTEKKTTNNKEEINKDTSDDKKKDEVKLSDNEKTSIESNSQDKIETVDEKEKNSKFNDKMIKNIFITIMTILLIINAIRMIVSSRILKK